MCLTFDSQYLVTGDSQGLIYVWNVSLEHTGGSGQTSPRAGAGKSGELHTFELHKDKGAVTNLLCIHRPLSLFGLTANMKAYEPPEIKAFSKVQSEPGQDLESQKTLVSLLLQDTLRQDDDSDLWSKLEHHEEMEYFLRASHRVLKPTGTTAVSQSVASALLSEKPEVIKFDADSKTEIERLKEENRRLKRTLIERFDQTFD